MLRAVSLVLLSVLHDVVLRRMIPSLPKGMVWSGLAVAHAALPSDGMATAET
jgi:hypothetical protein